MKRLVTITTILALSLLSAYPAIAHPRIDGGGGGGYCAWGSSYHRMYDQQTVKTITGEVVDVDYTSSGRGRGRGRGMYGGGVHLRIKTSQEEIPVHLGPRWYMEQQDMQIQVGDKIEVKGSQITYDGQSTMIAGEIKKGDRLLKLRHSDGVPYWAGRGRWY
ncbi:MAG: hypothetical protein QNJ47_13405 [Nostocaceae cyanobacterium]|nr:hypothetical protein [Nostocaceae cyanobacterium]